MHLGVTLSTLFFNRVGGFDDGGVDQRALLHHDASLVEPQVDGVEDLTGQLVQFQQIPEIHDGGSGGDGLV